MTVREMASLGGKATAKKYKGTGFLEDRARMSAETLKLRYGGNNYFKLIRRKLKPSKMTPEQIEEALKVSA